VAAGAAPGAHHPGRLSPALAQGKPDPAWIGEFPKTDFKKTSIPFLEIDTDWPRRDQIPPVNNPQYIQPAGDIQAADDKELGPIEPVISVIINGDARAFPLRILLWHESVNETIGGVPVLVS